MNKETILTKINIVNLNSFISPIGEDLTAIELQLQNLIENNMESINFNGLKLVEYANNTRASLNISNAHGETKVMSRYCDLLKIIENGDFQNQLAYKEAVSLAILVNNQLISHIDRLSEDKNYLAANLWRSWSKLGLFFNVEYININELFVPCGDFSDIKFRKAKKEDLEKLVGSVSLNYKNAVLDYETTSLKEKAKEALGKILDTLNILINIKSSKVFHEYWFALKARIALALKDPNYELDNKSNLVNIIKKSEINLNNYGAGSTKLPYEVLEEVCLNLLNEFALSLSKNDKDIYEFYKRFYVSEFLEQAKKIMISNEIETSKELHHEFVKNIKFIREDVIMMANKWKVLEYNEEEKTELLKMIKNFISESKAVRFGDKVNQDELLLILQAYVDIYKSLHATRKMTEPFPHYLCLEYAAFHLLVEFYLDRKGEIGKDFKEMLILATDRLKAALNKDLKQLNSLPANKWKGDVKERLDKKLVNDIIEDLKLELNKIKHAYKDFTNKDTEKELFAEFYEDSNETRNTPKIKEAFNNLIALGKNFYYAHKLLETMGYPYAGKLVNAISIMIENLNATGLKLPNKKSNEIFSMAVGACEIFFEDVMSGSDHPEKILEAVFIQIFNDENFRIEKEGKKFELPPLILSSNEDENSSVEYDDGKEIDYKKNKVVIEEESAEFKDEVLPKFNEFRNSEGFMDKFDETKIVMEVQSKEEESEEVKQKQKEAERKKEELTPREIVVDMTDEDCLVDLYIEEILGEEVSQCFYDNLDKVRQDPTDKKAFKEIRRIFHTWKGSGKQVDLYSLGYVAEALNLLYDRRMDMNIPWNNYIENTAIVAFNQFKEWAGALLADSKVYFDPQVVFDAIKEEEDYYQNNLATQSINIVKDDLDDDLTEEIQLSFGENKSEIQNPTVSTDEVKSEETIEETMVIAPVVEEVSATVVDQSVKQDIETSSNEPQTDIQEEVVNNTVVEEEFAHDASFTPKLDEEGTFAVKTLQNEDHVPENEQSKTVETPYVEEQFEFKNDENNNIELKEKETKVDESVLAEKSKLSTESLSIDSIAKLSSEFEDDDNNKQDFDINVSQDEKEAELEAERLYNNISHGETVDKEDLEHDVDNDEILLRSLNDKLIDHTHSLMKNNLFCDDIVNTLDELLEVDQIQDQENSLTDGIKLLIDVINDLEDVKLTNEQTLFVRKSIDLLINLVNLIIVGDDIDDMESYSENIKTLEDFLFEPSEPKVEIEKEKTSISINDDNDEDNNTFKINDLVSNEQVSVEIKTEEKGVEILDPIETPREIEHISNKDDDQDTITVSEEEAKLDIIIQKLTEMKLMVKEIKEILTDFE